MIEVLYFCLRRLPVKLTGSNIFLIVFIWNVSYRNKKCFGINIGAFRITKYECGWKMKQQQTIAKTLLLNYKSNYKVIVNSTLKLFSKQNIKT